MFTFNTSELLNVEQRYLSLNQSSNNCKKDCNESDPIIRKALDFKSDAITNLAIAYDYAEGLNLDSGNQVKQSVLQDFNLISKNSQFFDQTLKNQTTSFLYKNVKIKNPETVLTDGQSKQTSKILSNLMMFTYDNECNCATQECKNFMNITIDALEKISKSALALQIPGQDSFNLTT